MKKYRCISKGPSEQSWILNKIYSTNEKGLLTNENGLELTYVTAGLLAGKFDVEFEEISKQPKNKYTRTVPSTQIDVYNVLKAFNVTCPATQHAIKKLLAGGQRGQKDLITDLEEAKSSIQRAIELEKEDNDV